MRRLANSNSAEKIIPKAIHSLVPNFLVKNISLFLKNHIKES